MTRALVISLFLHVSILALFFVSKPVSRHEVANVPVELVSLGVVKKARKKRVKGNQVVKKRTIKKLQSTDGESSSQKAKGQDKEDIKEIVASSAESTLAIVSYAQELKNYIEKNRYYPRRALRMGQSGVVKVKLTIAPNGAFSKVEILEPARFEVFNRAVTNLFSEIGSFKPLPSSYGGNGEFIVPIKYEIKHGRM